MYDDEKTAVDVEGDAIEQGGGGEGRSQRRGYGRRWRRWSGGEYGKGS